MANFDVFFLNLDPLHFLPRPQAILLIIMIDTFGIFTIGKVSTEHLQGNIEEYKHPLDRSRASNARTRLKVQDEA